jgi:drug/metabolite transporter (DMT)-like permease
LLGVILVIRPEGVAVRGHHLAGALLSLSAAAVWVWYSLAVVPLVRAAGTIRTTAWSLSAAAFLLTPIALPGTVHLAWSSISWPAWGGLLYSSIVGMVVALTLWVRSVHELGANQTMIFLYVEPISAVVIAALVLGESLSIVQMVGAVMTFAGLWYAAR